MPTSVSRYSFVPRMTSSSSPSPTWNCSADSLLMTASRSAGSCVSSQRPWTSGYGGAGRVHAHEFRPLRGRAARRAALAASLRRAAAARVGVHRFVGLDADGPLKRRFPLGNRGVLVHDVEQFRGKRGILGRIGHKEKVVAAKVLGRLAAELPDQGVVAADDPHDDARRGDRGQRGQQHSRRVSPGVGQGQLAADAHRFSSVAAAAVPTMSW